MNVNTTYTVFYEPGILSQLIAKYLNQSDIPDRFSQAQHDRITDLIRGLQFKPLHRPQVSTRLKIKRLCPTNVYQETIDMPESGERMDVYSYFQRRYDITLNYSHLVEIEGRRNDKIPIELCNIIEVLLFCSQQNESRIIFHPFTLYLILQLYRVKGFLWQN